MLEILVGIFIITALHCAFRDSVDPHRHVELPDDLDELFSSPTSMQLSAYEPTASYDEVFIERHRKLAEAIELKFDDLDEEFSSATMLAKLTRDELEGL